MIALKQHQDAAVLRVLSRFLEVRDLLGVAATEGDRETARRSGCVMLEAPTGAGKTVMAGTLAERFSGFEKVVWFWFAPFSGIVDQSKDFLRGQFKGLRVRNLRADRHPEQARGGDVYVTTWASVAASNTEGRKIRQKRETMLSLDEFVPALRERGFRIGVVVDEAHHGFKRQTQALALFKVVLAPEYTLLVSATPDDKELAEFARELGVDHPAREVLTRAQAVEMGLVKRGIKAVAYLADAAVAQIVDHEMTALTDGWRLHNEIRGALASAGIPLVPLMLVQVESAGKGHDEKRVKEKLLTLGVPESAIAVHTASEPDPDVLAVANDESKEVLIFKMAVALGFDAPRAFVLVSSRSSRKADFGIQVCGRIMRVHRRVQGRTDVPAVLDYGYVLLADPDSQEGFVQAAQKIDQICAEIGSAQTPTVIAVRVGDRMTIQKVGPEGPSLLHGLEGSEPTLASVSTWLTGRIPQEIADGHYETNDLFPSMGARPATGEEDSSSVIIKSSATKTAYPAYVPQKTYRYALRSDVPRFLKTHVLPTEYDGLAEDVVTAFYFSEPMLLAGQREVVQVTRRTTEVFSGDTQRERFQAQLSHRQIAVIAQEMLFSLDGPNPDVIRNGLLQKLQDAYQRQGIAALTSDSEPLRHALALILATFPQALRTAMKQCLNRYAPVKDALGPLPEELLTVEPLMPSERNAYRFMPPDLNTWERKFAGCLDADTTGVVKWWHRNKPWRLESVCVPLPSGKAYFPDFVICLAGRKKGDGILLVETKERVYDPLAEEKVEAEHKFYGRPLMLTLENERFMSVRFNPHQRRNELDRIFSLDWAAGYE
ncbi:MAG: DEAD/DEAH box helicase family protein [Kiritimatiellae bacterium]|nr:DEAD/DEAH box helicase family protein [Kiritimatiellia bacterium]